VRCRLGKNRDGAAGNYLTMSSPGDLEADARAYYDRIADDYDRQLDTPDTWTARRCFWQCAEAVLPAKASILDFGAGTGIDAEHFASLGHRVTAYDLSGGMLAVLRRRCAEQVAGGTIAPIGGPLAEAREAIAARAPYDAVVCNFAILTHLAHLEPAMRLFADWVRAGGTVLIGIQNPWFPADLREGWYLKSLLRAPLAGAIRYRLPESGYGYRHTPGQVRRSARPEFVREPTPLPPCRRQAFGARSAFRLVALRRR
jgi:SAM-dependent methyltransferase